MEQIVVLPLVHCLLENKNQDSYTKVFDVINTECERLGIQTSLPQFVMTDFEIGIINVVQCQTVFRHIQAEGLQEASNNPNDGTIKTAAQIMCALAFTPIADVVKNFNLLMDEFPESFLPIAEYFEVIWFI